MHTTISSHPGFTVASIAQESAPTTTLHIFGDIHTENSLPQQAAGLLLADMLLAGTRTRSRQEILDAIEATGGAVSIKVRQGTVQITITALTATFPKLLQLLGNVLSESTFPKGELARAKQLAVNQLHEAKEDSRTRAHTALLNQLYDHRDRRYTYGIDELSGAVTALTKKDLEHLLQRFQTVPWTISIASDTTTITKLAQWCIKLRNAHSTSTPTQSFNAYKAIKSAVLKTEIPSRQNIDFSIGGFVPLTTTHPDFIPLQFGIAVLGKWGGFTGRLMSTVREKEGLTYGIYAQLEQMTAFEPGIWRIMTFFSPAQAAQGITSTLREFTQLVHDGITDDELRKFKRIITTGDQLIQDSVRRHLEQLHTYHVMGLSIDEIAARKARIATLTREEVNQAIQTYLVPHAVVISGAGPMKNVHKQLISVHQSIVQLKS
jgi:zinc protease